MIKIFKDLGYYAAGILGSKLIFFLIVPFYSFFLSKKELGEYDLILISITIIFPIITLQISEGVYRLLLQHKNDNYEQNLIINSGLAAFIFGFMFFFVIAFLINIFIDYPYFFEAICLQFTYGLYIYVQQIARGLQNHKLFALLGILNTTLVIFFSVCSLYLYRLGFQSIIISISLAQLISLAAAASSFRFSFCFRIKFIKQKTLHNLIGYSWPLLPNTISWWLIDLGNRFIILFVLGSEANGVYAVSARYAGIIALINSIIILSWQDYAIQKKGLENNIQKNFSKIFNSFMIFQLSLLGFLTAISKDIIQLTISSNFHEAQNYLPILFLSVVISSFCAFQGGVFLREKRTKQIFSTTSFGALGNLFLSLILIKHIGLYAVAIGSVFGFFITFLLRKQTIKLTINYRPALLLIVSFVIILISIQSESLSQKIFTICFSFLLFITMNLRNLKKHI